MAMARYGDASTGGGGAATAVQPTAPTLPAGIGNDQQVNQANQFLRAQPWYQEWLRQNGQQPNNVHLTKDQAFALLQMMRQKGVGISDAYSVDSSGNIVKDGMPGWEKAAIVAGIVVAGVLVAPAIVGALGAEGAASTGAAAAAGDTAAAGVLASTTIDATGALVAGGTGIGAGAGAAAAAGGAAAAVPALASTATVPTATGTVAGLASGSSTAGFSGAAGGSSIYGPAAGATGGGVTDALLRYGLPTASNIVSSIIGANASSNATDAQQKYLQEALDYEKSRDAAAISLEGQRYSNYSGNIAPYLATGNSANARMASLLGLPAAPTGYGPGGPAATDSATPPLSSQPSSTSTAAGSTIGAPTAPVTTGPPLPRVGTTVTMRAPDGSVQAVPAEQVDHYKSLGATVVGTAA